MTDHPSVTDLPRWRWWVHLVLIGGFFASGMVFNRHRGGPALTSSPRGLLLVSGINIAVFAVVFGVAWLTSRASLEQMFLRWRPGWWVLPLGFGYSIAIRLVVAVAAIAVAGLLLLTHLVTLESLQRLGGTRAIDLEKMVDLSAMQHQPLYYWLNLTLVSFVMAGLREELWRAGTLAAMRALWPRLFASRGGGISAVAIIALAFGAAHLVMGPIAAVAAGLLGFMLGLIIIFHHSIWPAVLAHGFFDALSLALLPYLLK